MITLSEPKKPIQDVRPSANNREILSSFSVQVPYDMACELKKIDPFVIRAALADVLKKG